MGACMKYAYLELLKKSLADTLHVNTYSAELISNEQGQPKDIKIYRSNINSYFKRQDGSDWPVSGETMIGIKRLDNIQECVQAVVHNNIPGDLIETGVWRGGATIFMKGCLKAFGNTDKVVWVADSFEGLPVPSINIPQDKHDTLSTIKFLAVPESEVLLNFSRYGLLDDKVKFLHGWFKNTLPELQSHKWSYIRLDADMYESTMDGLVNLYPGLSHGGYITIDDYGATPACRAAVDDYRKSHNIKEEIRQIDWTGVYWKKL